MTAARRSDLALLGIALLVIVADRLTKNWIVGYFASGTRPPIAIAGPVLQLQYVRNSGVAFSLFAGQNVTFALIALAIVVIGYLYWRTRASGSLPLKLAFGLVLGGAAGNLIDRFSHQYVVDFIHFQIPGVFNWPVFNVADSAISVGVVLLALVLWLSGTREAAPAAPAHAPASDVAGDAPTNEVTGDASGAGHAPLPDAAPRVRRTVSHEP